MWQFANHYPGSTILIVLICALTLFSLYNRTMRHLNIRKAGWPPPHCDADGDLRRSECETDD